MAELFRHPGPLRGRSEQGIVSNGAVPGRCLSLSFPPVMRMFLRPAPGSTDASGLCKTRPGEMCSSEK